MNAKSWIKRVSAAALLAAGAVVLAPSAEAANPATGTVNVSATVINSCSLSGGNLSFGNYIANGAAVSTSMTDTLACSGSAQGSDVATLTLTSTTNPVGGGYQMLNGGGVGPAYVLNYSLTASINGGAAQAITPATNVTWTLASNADTIKIGGTIASNQNVALGTFNDTLTESVAY